MAASRILWVIRGYQTHGKPRTSEAKISKCLSIVGQKAVPPLCHCSGTSTENPALPLLKQERHGNSVPSPCAESQATAVTNNNHVLLAISTNLHALTCCPSPFRPCPVCPSLRPICPLLSRRSLRRLGEASRSSGTVFPSHQEADVSLPTSTASTGSPPQICHKGLDVPHLLTYPLEAADAPGCVAGTRDGLSHAPEMPELSAPS